MGFADVSVHPGHTDVAAQTSRGRQSQDKIEIILVGEANTPVMVVMITTASR
ncbi:MAG TPA: hypothetical protein VK887_10500 [Pseudonocardiaceae bacterium]|nr:hypothetical protein [Pseudonocardiaceae bacterium]